MGDIYGRPSGRGSEVLQSASHIPLLADVLLLVYILITVPNDNSL